MVLNKKNLAFIFAALLGLSSVFAATVPELKGRVNDYANIIDKDTESELEEYLTALDNQTNVQMAVLTIPSLDGEDIASYGIKVADAWKIGHSEDDKGAILIVALEEHDVRIEVGYGLEGDLTDAKCGLIIRNVIIPEFKNGDYSEGILKGIKNMGGIASGDAELVEDTVENDVEEDGELAGMIFMIVWLIFFFIVVFSKGGLWKWLFLSRLFGGRNHYYSDFYRPHNSGSYFGNSSGFNSGSSFRSGSSFGSSGGGFSGGGGSFGGGGASGHW